MEKTLRLGIDSRPASQGAREFARASQTVQRSAAQADASVKKMEGGFARLRGAAGTLTAAFGALAAYGVGRELGRIFQAGDNAEASLRSLGATARLTGTSLGFLQETSRGASASLGLSEANANKLTSAMVRLTSAAGATTMTGRALNAYLDLAAANSIGAAEAGEMLNNILSGQDEALNRLGLANPSQIFAKWGASADRTSQLMAILNELIESGGKVLGSYAGYARSAAGQQAAMNDQLNAARAQLAEVLNPARVAGIQALTSAFRDLSGWIRENKTELTAVVDLLGKLAKFQGKVISIGVKVLASGGLSRAMFGMGMAAGSGGDGLTTLPGVRVSGPQRSAVGTIPGVTVQGTSRAELARLADERRSAADAAAADRFDSRWFGVSGRTMAGMQLSNGALAGQRNAPVAPGMIQGVTTPGVSRPTVSRMDLARDSVNNVGGNMLAALTGGFSSLLSSMGPVAMMFEVLNGVFAGIGPVLNQLMVPLRNLGHLIGSALTIPLKLLQPVLNGIAKAGSYVIEAFGWIIRTIGKAVDALPFVSGGPIIRAGQAMIDMAQQTRDAIDAQKDLTDTTKKLSQTLSTDVPKAYNLMLYRQMFGTGGGGASPGGTGSAGGGLPGGASGGGRMAKPKNPPSSGPSYSIGVVQITTHGGESGEQALQKIERAIQDRSSRGSPTYFPGVRTAA